MEIFKDIPNYKGFYQASSLGRITSLDRTINTSSGFRKLKGQLLKPSIDKDGYLKVVLWINGKDKTFRVHQLVYMAFKGEYNGLEVNHIDFNKKNNYISNLELLTHKENINHYWYNKNL